VTGEGATGLLGEIRSKPGVDLAAAFGNALHVAGTDAAALDAAIAPYRADPRLRWQKIEPSLEDVFIYTLARLGDERR
jgi:ABC-2 type transport system ATP-binding protein